MNLPNGEAAQLGDKLERYCFILSTQEERIKQSYFVSD
jgi:hypothetical protein